MLEIIKVNGIYADSAIKGQGFEIVILTNGNAILTVETGIEPASTVVNAKQLLDALQNTVIKWEA